ncbi:pentapeptide repeat-containing protein [Edaphobacter aggregans]|uniref:pentapeptide repeat-containing protein n=1 Tax=Edaphobacter aggregans TaxID=570835 RepID=UPI0012F8B31E|nr:pentapeptide repeat-containing protein [Edaphobacter aggregans]
MIILAARTGINPKALWDLERTCLSPHELDEDIFYCTWEKPRAGKQQRQLHRVDPFFKLATALNESERYTEWWPFRAQAGTSRQTDQPALSLDGIFLVRGKLADLRMPSLKGGRLRLHGAFLYEVDLSRARLIGAQMSKARLIGADLSGAVLTGSDLADTRLEEARFEGADLSNASVHNAKLWHARFDQESILVNVQWWTANFFDTLMSTAPNPTARLIDSEELNVDEQLITALLSRSRTDALVGAHESVKKHQQMREGRVV